MVDSLYLQYCAKLSFLFMVKISSSKNGCVMSQAVHTDTLRSELQVPLGQFVPQAFSFRVPLSPVILFSIVDFQSAFSDPCIAPERSIIWGVPPLLRCLSPFFAS